MKRDIIVTGASSGIGLATAKKFLDEGDRVFVGARRVVEMNKAFSSYSQAVVLPLDIADDKSRKAFAQKFFGLAQRPDVIVSNAGYGQFGPIETVSEAQFKEQFEVNVFGLVSFLQLFLPSMRQAGAGSIINISSVLGRFSIPYGAWYAATKHALEALTEGLYYEMHSFGVNVSLVEPGSISTEFGQVVDTHLKDMSPASSPYKEGLDRYFHAIRGDKKHSGSPQKVGQLIYKIANRSTPRLRYSTPFWLGTFLLILSKRCPVLFRHALCKLSSVTPNKVE